MKNHSLDLSSLFSSPGTKENSVHRKLLGGRKRGDGGQREAHLPKEGTLFGAKMIGGESGFGAAFRAGRAQRGINRCLALF